MKNTRHELKAEDKKYIQLTHSQILPLGIKDELYSGGKTATEIEERKLKYKNGEKSKLEKSKETTMKIKDEVKHKLETIHEIKNEEELNLKNKRKSLLNIKNEDKEKSSSQIEDKFQLEKKEKSKLKIQDELKSNREIQNNNIINSSNLNNKLNIIKEGNIRNQASLCTSFFKLEKRKEDNKVIIQKDALLMKNFKDKNSFFSKQKYHRKKFKFKKMYNK